MLHCQLYNIFLRLLVTVLMFTKYELCFVVINVIQQCTIALMPQSIKKCLAVLTMSNSPLHMSCSQQAANYVVNSEVEVGSCFVNGAS